jgi:hypothetical protein
MMCTYYDLRQWNSEKWLRFKEGKKLIHEIMWVTSLLLSYCSWPTNINITWFVLCIAFNTFTAKIDHSWFNNSCLRLPASTVVDLIFQSHSFSLGGKLVHLVDVIFIPFIVYYAYVAIYLTRINPGYLNRWQQMC